MTLFTKKLLRRACGRGVLWLVLALAVAIAPREATPQIWGPIIQFPGPDPWLCTQPDLVMDLSTGTTGNPPVSVAATKPDPKWKVYYGLAEGVPAPAFVTRNDPNWGILSSTQRPQWIQRKKSLYAQNDNAGFYIYFVNFSLGPTPSYNRANLTFRYAADNDAEVRLNGAAVSSCTGHRCFLGWHPSSAATLTSGFQNGFNTLQVAVTNVNSSTGQTVTGLIVDATLRACK